MDKHISFLKKIAKKYKKQKGITQTEALDKVARDTGFQSWKHLLSQNKSPSKPSNKLTVDALFDWDLTSLSKDDLRAHWESHLISNKSVKDVERWVNQAEKFIDENMYDYATYIYENLINMNISAAQNNLGMIYLKGQHVSHDLNKAFNLILLSAKQNNSEGQNNLGTMYLRGQGCQKDKNKAMDYFLKAAKQNHSGAASNVGALLQDDGLTLEAITWYKKAIVLDNDNINPLFNLGYLFSYSDESIKNYAESRKYFEKAAELNCVNSQFYLGMMYFYGRGVDKDIEKAKYWLLKAASEGSSTAQLNLGRLYYQEGDWGLARSFFEESSLNGNSEARKIMKRLFDEDIPGYSFYDI